MGIDFSPSYGSVAVRIKPSHGLGVGYESRRKSFDALVTILSSSVAKVVLWGFLVVFSYHALAGIRHLIMDMGVGEDFKGGALGARILFGAAAVAAVVWGVVLW